MKLSELIKLRNNLQNISFTALNHEVNDIDAVVSKNFNFSIHENYKSSLNNVIKLLSDIESQIENQQERITDLIQEVDKEIFELTATMMELDYTYKNPMVPCLSNYIVERTDRVLELSHNERGEISTVVRSYTSWQYPTLEIGPGDGEWTESLVAGDPLYIVDRHQEFIDSTLSKFNEIYRRRVRPYFVGTHGVKEFDYSALPQGQFGFIFAWNVVNFWPFKETKHTLKQCYDLLRPGGVMMFSFNNCDVVQCAEAAESGYKSYLTPTLLNNIFNKLGFEIIQYRSTSVHVHWVEIKKPGVLSTTKRHQTLGKIVSVGVPQEVDTDKDNLYNSPKYSKEEINNLKRQAIFLNIDTPDKIYNAYSPEKLEYLINLKRKDQ